ncbi:copper resistance protein B [Phenylobacterium terrae]|uniref:Copper resistance protein B n=1 Tax=Phenylobacterium terrae TaxID=2665495 RepID=A0ABW4MYP3_9CAUL
MRRLALIALAPLALATPALAQQADPHAGHHGHGAPADPHAGHVMPTPPADPHAGRAMPAAPADPHAGHAMPQAPADPHAGHHGHATPADPHAGHDMPPPSAPAPPPPGDHAADTVWSPQEMAAARAQLRAEHGDIRWPQVVVETLEARPSSDGDGYAWDGEVSYGGDINRFVLASEGEGRSGERPEHFEVQALWRRAVSPYFNLRAGVRQDFEPRPRRTYATLGVEGVSPYWVELSAAAFLSDAGKLSARLEASTDFRLTQRLVLQPSAEVNLAAQDDEAIGVGSGLSDLELGLRLRYHLTPAFAPYVGVVHERAVGGTADHARAHGEDVRDTRAVIGLQAMF